MSEKGNAEVPPAPAHSPHPAAPQVVIQADSVQVPAGQEEDFDTSPLFAYLDSERGHEVAQRVLGLFEAMRKNTIELTVKQVVAERWFQAAIIVVVVAASTTLAVVDKFSAPLGLLFGTLIGYVFGKHSSSP